MGRGSTKAALDLDRLRSSCGNCSLQELCLPSALGLDDLGRLADIVGHATYVRGQHVFNAGDPFRALYVVHRGSLKTSVTTLEGSVQILGFHLPGELVGFDGVAEHRYQCTAEPLEPTEVCSLPFHRLEHLAREIPALHDQLLRVISREVVLEHEHVLMMGSRPAIERLALFVQTLARRRGLVGHDRKRIPLAISRAEMGNYLSLATETVSRLFARLQREGIVRLGRHELEILDLNGLIEISGEDLDLIHCPD